MAAMRVAAALCAFALASGRALLRAGGEGELIGGAAAHRWANPVAGADGCDADHKCCARKVYAGPLGLALNEPRCVRRQDIQLRFWGFRINKYACAKYADARGRGAHAWVKAGRVGQACRQGVAPTAEGGVWHQPAAPWEPGDVPPGGVALHKYSLHWWPSVGPPCIQVMPWPDAEADAKNEQRGCFLFDFRVQEPIGLAMPGQVDVHWWGGGDPVLEYDNGWLYQDPSKSFQYPFPAFCARAAVSMLSTVYNPNRRDTMTLSGASVMFENFAYSDKKCDGVTKKDYDAALDTTKRSKACWNFCSDFITVLCYRFRRCRCGNENIAECSEADKIDCCRSRFVDFLNDGGAPRRAQYEGMVRAHLYLNWTVARMQDAWERSTNEEGAP